jgi:hypothetical protein
MDVLAPQSSEEIQGWPDKWSTAGRRGQMSDDHAGPWALFGEVMSGRCGVGLKSPLKRAQPAPLCLRVLTCCSRAVQTSWAVVLTESGSQVSRPSRAK